MENFKYCDKRVTRGKNSALLYRENGEEKFHILIPLETIPSVFGSIESLEYNLLSCDTTGSIEGDETLEQQEIEFMWHRDNVRKLERLQGKDLEFMAIYSDRTARRFSGTLRVRPPEADSDILRGIMTITPSSAVSQTLLDARPLYQPTIRFTKSVPNSIEIPEGENGYQIEIATNPDNININASIEDEDPSSSAFSVNFIGKKVTITRNTSVANEEGTYYGIVLITATDSTNEYYKNEISVAVSYTIE